MKVKGAILNGITHGGLIEAQRQVATKRAKKSKIRDRVIAGERERARKGTKQ